MFLDNLTTQAAVCPGCNSDCEAVLFGGKLRYLCDECADADKARRAHKERSMEAMALWRAYVPAEYQIPIDVSLVHPALVPALELDGSEGAGFTGTNGSGKTRVACHIARRAAARGIKPFFISASLLRQSAADKHNDDKEVASRAQSRLMAARFAQLLVLDDVGKGSRTEGGDELLFELLSFRRDNRRVTLWTANGNGEWIAARYGDDRGPAIAIRLAHLAGCQKRGTGRIFTATAEAAAAAPAPRNILPMSATNDAGRSRAASR